MKMNYLKLFLIAMTTVLSIETTVWASSSRIACADTDHLIDILHSTSSVGVKFYTGYATSYSQYQGVMGNDLDHILGGLLDGQPIGEWHVKSSRVRSAASGLNYTYTAHRRTNFGVDLDQVYDMTGVLELNVKDPAHSTLIIDSKGCIEQTAVLFKPCLGDPEKAHYRVTIPCKILSVSN